jgi:DMSO reductase anchor subunit
MALTAIGLVSSTFHLGKPLRAWRAFSQWRTSWLSREGLLALSTYVPALALIGLFSAILTGAASAGLPAGKLAAWLGGILAMLSLLTVACTAMIYASLKPIPAWRHRLVVPIYLVFALFTGITLIMALSTLASGGPASVHVAISHGLMLVPAGFAVTLATMKLMYWRAIDRIKLPSRESATALEGVGTVTTFERPHTEANYLTNEMGFVLARKHSRKLRIIALLLFAGIPLLTLLIAALLPATAGIALWIAALAALAGAFVERWLFFAEAKHMVMLYY